MVARGKEPPWTGRWGASEICASITGEARCSNRWSRAKRCAGACPRSPSQTGGKVVACRFPERWVAATHELIEVAVEDACSGLKQQMSAPRGPPHRLTLVKAFVHDLVDRGLHEAGGKPC